MVAMKYEKAFYFDVGGVLIPDNFAVDNALNTFRQLATRYSFNPQNAYATYAKLQPLLDVGRISLPDLCRALKVDQKAFERDWLAMHPVDRGVIRIIATSRNWTLCWLSHEFLQALTKLVNWEYSCPIPSLGLLFVRYWLIEAFHRILQSCA